LLRCARNDFVGVFRISPKIISKERNMKRLTISLAIVIAITAYSAHLYYRSSIAYLPATANIQVIAPGLTIKESRVIQIPSQRVTIAAEGIVALLAVDLDRDSQVREDLKTGTDVFLVKVDKAPDGKTNVYAFNGIKTLAQFDIDKDGMIDARDKVFPEFAVAMLVPGRNVFQVVPLNKAGIFAIWYDRNMLSESDDELAKEKSIGYAIHSHNLHNNLHVILKSKQWLTSTGFDI